MAPESEDAGRFQNRPAGPDGGALPGLESAAMERERLDTFLARKAQAFDPSALVVCVYLDDSAERWELRRAQHPPLILGRNFGEAKAGLDVWKKSQRATGAAPRGGSPGGKDDADDGP